MNRAALVLICFLTACGSARSASSPTGYAFDRLVTYEEIRTAKYAGTTAWDLLSKIRPNFLRSRGPSSLRDLTPVTAVVYVNGSLYGKLESLKSLNAEDLREIEFIDASEATTRFGTDHVGGAILIRTR